MNYKILVNGNLYDETDYTMHARQIYDNIVIAYPYAHVQLKGRDNVTYPDGIILDTDRDGHKPVYDK